MARFVDQLAQLNIEIVDDWMFFYSRRQLSTLDPATWSWLFGAVGAVMTKLDQWARWRDERLRTLAQPSALPGPAVPGPGVPGPGVPGPDGMPAGTASRLPFATPSAPVMPPPPGVAPPGRRLRTRSPWLLVAIIVLVTVGAVMLPFALAVAGVLFGG